MLRNSTQIQLCGAKIAGLLEFLIFRSAETGPGPRLPVRGGNPEPHTAPGRKPGAANHHSPTFNTPKPALWCNLPFHAVHITDVLAPTQYGELSKSHDNVAEYSLSQCRTFRCSIHEKNSLLRRPEALNGGWLQHFKKVTRPAAEACALPSLSPKPYRPGHQYFIRDEAGSTFSAPAAFLVRIEYDMQGIKYDRTEDTQIECLHSYTVLSI